MKAENIRKCEQQIKVYECFVKCMPYIKDIIKSFDNKVLNKRIVTALNEKISEEIKQGTKFYLSPCYDSDYTTLTFSNYSTLRDVYMTNEDGSKIFIGYVDTYLNSLNLYVNKLNNRIDSEKTIEYIDKILVPWLFNNIAICKDCINNYDYYLSENEKLVKFINEYKKKVPYMMQHQIILNRNYDI
ncbi:MAG: hypothetical protein IAC58_07135 [Firmicutes bacterium]|uniref:Uncharacterized protein n=1 Tax=Candidatus Onthovivens merdipullorum TaxID=2840889 RepID=A0A9D9DIM9_9BACL|nr:hypothetical protein [Candidatus Onthovivens merdipullorum]